MEISDEVNRGRVGSRYWVNCENDSFSEITNKNFQLPHNWAHSQPIRDGKYSEAILKPVNGYAMNFYPIPELHILDNSIALRYKTHAEIWLEKMSFGLYALDKTWQRQFYPSQLQQQTPQDCFNALYKFYVPWIIDKDIECRVESIADSPFKIIKDSVSFNKLDDGLIWNVDWFHFAIKNNSSVIQEYHGDTYGIIEVGSNICDVIIEDQDTIKELVKQYGK